MDWHEGNKRVAELMEKQGRVSCSAPLSCWESFMTEGENGKDICMMARNNAILHRALQQGYNAGWTRAETMERLALTLLTVRDEMMQAEIEKLNNSTRPLIPPKEVISNVKSDPPPQCDDRNECVG